MIRIRVASFNPVKPNAARAGFARAFPGETLIVEGVEAASGVAAQPMSDAETLRGAENRAENAARMDPEANFWVGLEGGVEARPEGLCAFAWVVVRGRGSSHKSEINHPQSRGE